MEPQRVTNTTSHHPVRKFQPRYGLAGPSFFAYLYDQLLLQIYNFRKFEQMISGVVTQCKSSRPFLCLLLLVINAMVSMKCRYLTSTAIEHLYYIPNSLSMKIRFCIPSFHCKNFEIQCTTTSRRYGLSGATNFLRVGSKKGGSFKFSRYMLN